MSFLHFVFAFGIGAGFVFLLVKSGPTLKQKRTVNQLLDDKKNLKNDNASLEDRNANLAKKISENGKDIINLKEEVKQLRADVDSNSELLTSVTFIRDKVGKDSRIIIGDRFKKKYGLSDDND